MHPPQSTMYLVIFFIIHIFVGCSKPPQSVVATSTLQSPPQQIDTELPTATQTEANPSTEGMPTTSNNTVANVLSVAVRGEQGAYQFSVEISSPDLGCEQYADWWEVIDEHGKLLYRRILTHSHVSEQPFIRSGGPVNIAADTPVWVRAHMNSAGYGGQAFKGTVTTGFQPDKLPSGFADDLAQIAPLPEGCAF